MTLPLGVTPILGTACPTGWGVKTDCVGPSACRKGSAVPGSSGFISYDGGLSALVRGVIWPWISILSLWVWKGGRL